MRSIVRVIVIAFTLVILTGCGSPCPPDTITYVDPPYPPENPTTIPLGGVIEIKGMELRVDKVITGFVCNDSWSGQIYVTCDIQIPSWEEDAFFFRDCNLDIEPDTVVYVEAHNNDPYLKGCSCHE